MIIFQIERLKRAKLIDEIIVATTDKKKDDTCKNFKFL